METVTKPLSASKNTTIGISQVLHPLQPLVPKEIGAVVSVLKKEGKVVPTTRFVSVSLKEPLKKTVMSFDGNNFPPREAFVVLFNNASNECYEAIVSITDEKLVSYLHVPGVQPTMTIDEQIECEQAVMQSAEFKKALEDKYGPIDMDLLMVDIWSVGNYGAEEENTMRLARPLVFLRADPLDNGYARPIEGIKPVVDLNTMKVIHVEEYGHWPLPPESCNYIATPESVFRQDLKPIEVVQPEGPSFTVKGYEVDWQKWNFVIGFNAREGLVINQLSYFDQGRKRMILYRASLSEMVVPYGDPRPTQKRKNAFDTGEYGMGMCANSLELGCDCLGYIQYFDAHLTDSRGNLLTVPNAICMHEEDYGILWKHTDRRMADRPEVRRSRRLVISSISTVENYEYGFFWYLYQDGNIQFEIKLTGILSLGALLPGEKLKYGTLVAPQLYAPNHQHFFNMRLDFDLDGAENTVHEMNIEADPEGDENPFENAFYAKSTRLLSEKGACRQLDLQKSRYWKIVNENMKNKVGDPVSYKFMAGDNTVPYASPKASWRKRAGFVNHHVWVTPFDEGEKYAAGNYPNQSKGGDGLIKWVEQDRNTENTDVVFWYTMGHTHLPRPEDYPVMPTAYIGFLLKPNGFFDMNPANDVPPTSKPGDGTPSCCA